MADFAPTYVVTVFFRSLKENINSKARIAEKEKFAKQFFRPDANPIYFIGLNDIGNPVDHWVNTDPRDDVLWVALAEDVKQNIRPATDLAGMIKRPN